MFGLWLVYRIPATTDWPNGSRSVTGAEGVRFQASSATITATKDTALIANTAAAPTAATNNPAMGGPTARAVSTETPPSDAAERSCSRGTSSGWIACQAGVVSAAAQPTANISTSRETASNTPATASAANTAAAIAPYACTAMSSRRRSTRSASAPANSAKISVGVRLAVCTSAMTVGLS